MAATINVNDRTVVHKDSGGVSIAFPDVCKTPTPGGPVPIPYPNIAMSKDASKGSKSVKMDGNPIMLKGSLFSTSTGDEAGTAGGGIISSKTKGKAEFINYSFDVMVEGKNVPRLADMMVQNKGSPANTPPIAEIQPPMPPAVCAENPAEEISLSLCDVTELKIRNTADNTEVSCTTRARADCSLTSEQKALLGQYDLLMECVADFENNYGIEPTQKAKISVDSTNDPAAGTCPSDATHGGVHYSALQNGDEADGLPCDALLESVEYELLAPSVRDSAGRGGWLSDFWSFNDNQKIIAVSTFGCGIRESSTPNGMMKGLIRIYPKQSWKLSLKIPSFATISHSRSGSVDMRGNVVSQTSSSSTSSFGASRSSSATSSNSNLRSGDNTVTTTISETIDRATSTLSETEGVKDGDVFIRERETYDTGTAYLLGGPSESLIYTDDTADPRSLIGQRAFTVNPAFTLEINGHSLAVTERINNIIGIAKLVRDTWNELQEWAPKVGWSASLDLGFLEGTISGEWGTRVSQDIQHARIVHVEPYYTLSLEVVLFRCQISLSFGVDFKVNNWFSGRPVVEIVVQLVGTIGVRLPLKADYTSGNHSQEPLALSAKSTAQIQATARAVLFNVVAEASISIDGGFSIDSAFKCGFEQDPIVEAKIYTLPLILKIILIRPDKDPWRKEKELLGRRDIWEGSFPKPDPS